MEGNKDMLGKRTVPLYRRERAGYKKKLPLDLPLPQRAYRSRNYGREDTSNELYKTGKLIRNVIIAASIVVAVVVLKSIDVPFTQRLVGHIRSAVTDEFDIDNALGSLKFVENYLPDVKSVFGEQGVAAVPIAPPAQGKVTGLFGEAAVEGGHKRNSGIDISCEQGSAIYASADGQVVDIGESRQYGKYIKIDHGDGMLTLYGGCSEINVRIGDRVKQGERVGSIGANGMGDYVLHFEVWVDGQPTDPLALMDLDG